MDYSTEYWLCCGEQNWTVILVISGNVRCHMTLLPSSLSRCWCHIGATHSHWVLPGAPSSNKWGPGYSRSRARFRPDQITLAPRVPSSARDHFFPLKNNVLYISSNNLTFVITKQLRHSYFHEPRPSVSTCDVGLRWKNRHTPQTARGKKWTLCCVSVALKKKEIKLK